MKYWSKELFIVTITVFGLVVSLTFAAESSGSPENGTAPFNAGEIIEQSPLYSSTSYSSNVIPQINEQVSSWSQTSEFLIDTSITYIPAHSDQSAATVAFDGTNYLVVWSDRRAGRPEIYCTRVDTSGTVYDPSGVRVSTSSGDQHNPSVCFGDTNYLVVWEDRRNGLEDIYGARVNQAGNVLDTAGIAIATTSDDQYVPSVASDGTNYLVVWEEEHQTGFDIYAARVDQTGTVLDPMGIGVSTFTGNQEFAVVAFDGTNYMVAWQDERNGSWDIYVARVDTLGNVLDQFGIPVTTDTAKCQVPAIAFDGTNYLVLWEKSRNASVDICGTRVDKDGNVLDPSGITVSVAPDSQQYPSVAFDGTNYLVVWQDRRSGRRDIYGTRVDILGNVLDPGGIAITTETNAQEIPSVAFSNTHYLIMWGERTGPWWAWWESEDDICGTRVDQAGSILDTTGITISTVANSQTTGDIAFDGTNYLVVWHDERNWLSSDLDIYAARVDQSGTVLDPECIAISTSSGDQHNPSVCFGDTNYLVVWEDRRNGLEDIYGARVNLAGNVLDTAGFIISMSAPGPQRDPCVAFDGTNYMVVWSDNRNDHLYVYGARVDQAGNVLDIPYGILIWEGYSPTVMFDGTHYLVVWRKCGFHTQYYPSLCGMWLDTAGNILNPGGFVILEWEDRNHGRSPTAASDGTNYLVVWTSWSYDLDYSWDIYAARFDQAGNVLDSAGIPITTAIGDQSNPSVCFDGTEYFVIWEDGRNDGIYDIYGVTLTTSGMISDSFVVAGQSGDQFSPTVVRGADNQILVAYSGWTDSINTHPASAMRIWGKFYYAAGAEENAGVEIRDTGLSLTVHPNPCHGKAVIRYGVRNMGYENQFATLKIYDASGRIVRLFDLTSQIRHRRWQVIWDGTDQSNRRLPSGVYFMQLKSGNAMITEKLLFIK
jgi:hypothetical protein